MNLFYTNSVIKSADQEEFLLEEQEAAHAGKVLRVTEGDTVRATDGLGTIYEGIVTTVTRHEIRVKVADKIFSPKQAPEISIAVGNIKKRDRLEFAVEKAVELGVSQVIIFQAAHSEKKSIRLGRLKSTALSAMKQSLRAWLPDISVEQSLEELLKKNRNSRIIVADENKKDVLKNRDVLKNEQQVLFIVGPEGGFTADEMKLIDGKGYEKISLGGYRLRTETAVITVAALASNFYDE